MLARWRPPTPFPMTLHYHGGRAVPLWVMPFMKNSEGKVVHYLAAGPAGKPVDSARLASIDAPSYHGREGAHVRIVDEPARDGQTVFSALSHTLN